MKLREESFLAQVKFIPCINFVSRSFPKHTDKVLGDIYTYCIKEGKCFASIDRISKDCGISYSTVIRCIQRLEEVGFITDLTPEVRNHPHVYTFEEEMVLEAAREYDNAMLETQRSAHSELPTGSSGLLTGGSERTSHSFNLTDEYIEESVKELVGEENNSLNELIVPNAKDILDSLFDDLGSGLGSPSPVGEIRISPPSELDNSFQEIVDTPLVEQSDITLAGEGVPLEPNSNLILMLENNYKRKVNIIPISNYAKELAV
jgi:hypothetical protein